MENLRVRQRASERALAESNRGLVRMVVATEIRAAEMVDRSLGDTAQVMSITSVGDGYGWGPLSYLVLADTETSDVWRVSIDASGQAALSLHVTG
jgi:hypothetical protein